MEVAEMSRNALLVPSEMKTLGHMSFLDNFWCSSLCRSLRHSRYALDGIALFWPINLTRFSHPTAIASKALGDIRMFSSPACLLPFSYTHYYPSGLSFPLVEQGDEHLRGPKKTTLPLVQRSASTFRTVGECDSIP